MGGWWLLVALALAPPVEGDPRLQQRGGDLWLTLSQSVLGEAEVRDYLDSGLTTSLLVRIQFRDGQGQRFEGSARIDLRFEPWDEVYFATVWDLNGMHVQQELKNRAALEQWWRALQLLLYRDKGVAPCRPTRVSLEVLPFSAQEQNNARNWVREVGGTRDGPSGAEGQSTANIQLLNVLVATSMQRKPLMRFTWRVSCLREP